MKRFANYLVLTVEAFPRPCHHIITIIRPKAHLKIPLPRSFCGVFFYSATNVKQLSIKGIFVFLVWIVPFSELLFVLSVTVRSLNTVDVLSLGLCGLLLFDLTCQLIYCVHLWEFVDYFSADNCVDYLYVEMGKTTVSDVI